MQAAKKLDPTLSDQPKSPSEAAQDWNFFISFGLIISARLGDVDKIRAAIQEEGGKVIFQTATTAPLYLLRHYEIEQILRGDTSHIREVHDKKSKERSVRLEK